MSCLESIAVAKRATVCFLAMDSFNYLATMCFLAMDSRFSYLSAKKRKKKKKKKPKEGGGKEEEQMNQLVDVLRDEAAKEDPIFKKQPSVDVLDDPNRKTLPFFASAKSCLVTEKPETLMRVRNQERTNACATFVTTAVIYGAQVRHGRHAVPGSPQEILDYGGIFQRPKEVKAKTGPYLLHSRIPYSYRLTFNYATKIGISPASVYKWDGNCKFRGWDGSKWDGVVEYDGKVIERAEKVFIKKKSELIPPSEVDDILKHQPLTGMITITDEFINWKSEEIYRGGGFAWLDGETPLKHAVTIVGHGVEGKDAYFICQNSYGLGWGYRGYFKVLRSLITHKYIAELLDVEEAGREDGGGEESGEKGDASCGQGLKRKFGEESGEKGDASCGQGLKRKCEDM